MEQNNEILKALTFDDVSLIPAQSDFLPNEADVRTRFSRNIPLNIPISTASMDTVTEHRMAIEIARLGGIGIIHKNMPIAEQAREVHKAKRAESAVIIDPVTLKPDNTIADALALMQENSIGGIPVVTESNILVGIVTNRDLRFEKNFERKISEVMTKEGLVTVPPGTDLKDAEKLLAQYKIEKLPVVDEHKKLCGLITYKDMLRAIDNPNRIIDKTGRLICGAAISPGSDLMERVEALRGESTDVLVLDTAHGHSKGVFDAVKLIKKNYPQQELVAGNVATREGVEYLIEAGVDGAKMGIGPGSICSTRIIAGIGIPQFSAILLGSSAVKKSGITIIADGGIRYSGDIAKAIAAGADCIMAGGLFAGTDESPGRTIIRNGRKYKEYRGMGSIEAMEKGSKDRYFQADQKDPKKLVAEGVSGDKPYVGSLKDEVYQLIGGLRNSMGYCGTRTISAMKGKSYALVTQAGQKEAHPHDVSNISDAPNYSAHG